MRGIRLRAAAFALAAALLAVPGAVRAQETGGGGGMPTSLEGWTRRHDAMLAAGRAEEALREARERTEREPKNPEALYLYGRVLGNTGEVEQARLQFQGALELDINFAPAWRGMAKVHLRAEDFDTAAREAQKAFDLEPTNQEGRVLLVQCLYQKGERPRAYAILQEELTRHPDDADLRFFYASLLANERRTRDAEKELGVILAAHPDHGAARETLAAILDNTGRRGEAVACCREGLKTQPKNPRLWALLRDLCVQERDYAGAVAAVEGLLRCDLSPENRRKVEEDLHQVRSLRDAPGQPAGPPTDDEILRMVQSPDVTVRREAMRLLSEAGVNYVPVPVLKAVTDPDETVRLYAVRILGEHGDAGVAGLLSLMLFDPGSRDPSETVRAAAAYALGNLAERGMLAVLPVLFRALEEDSPEVLRAAVRGIARVTGKCLVDDPAAPIPEKERPRVREEYRRWWMESATGRFWRRKTAAAVGRAGDRNLAAILVPWILDPDGEVRESLLAAMATLTREPAWRDLPTGTPEERTEAAEKIRVRLTRPLPETTDGDR